jgi:hypothetical protein
VRSKGSRKRLEWTNLTPGKGLACVGSAFTGAPILAWNTSIVGALIVCCPPVALPRLATIATRR